MKEEEEEEEEEDWPAHDDHICGDVTHRDDPARATPEVAEPIREPVSILEKTPQRCDHDTAAAAGVIVSEDRRATKRVVMATGVHGRLTMNRPVRL